MNRYQDKQPLRTLQQLKAYVTGLKTTLPQDATVHFQGEEVQVRTLVRRLEELIALYEAPIEAELTYLDSLKARNGRSQEVGTLQENFEAMIRGRFGPRNTILKQFGIQPWKERRRRRNSGADESQPPA